MRQAVASQPRLRVEQWLRLAEDKAFAIDDAARDLDYAPRPFSTGIQAEAACLGLAAKAMTREKEACLASRYARWPRYWVSTCRYGVRPGCCSVPTPGHGAGQGRRSGA